MSFWEKCCFPSGTGTEEETGTGFYCSTCDELVSSELSVDLEIHRNNTCTDLSVSGSGTISREEPSNIWDGCITMDSGSSDFFVKLFSSTCRLDVIEHTPVGNCGNPIDRQGNVDVVPDICDPLFIDWVCFSIGAGGGGELWARVRITE